MTPEIREAAERLKARIELSDPSDIGDILYSRKSGEVLTAKDIYLVADAFLAEHPSDSDTPVDEGWLRSVGFESDRTGCPTLMSLHIQSSRSAAYQPYACVRSLPIPVPKTRGEVRALCRLLGIPLTPAD